MSTAHRPTWNPSTGGNGLRDGSTAPLSLQTSAKDQPAHKKLKYRHKQQTEEQTSEQILALEEGASEDDDSLEGSHDSSRDDTDREAESANNSDIEEESEDESTDEEALLAELQKIRQERRHAQAVRSNPLKQLDESAPVLKRRWDEDTVFRGQHSTTKKTEKGKRFINDTTRSDNHRNFMDKYIK